MNKNTLFIILFSISFLNTSFCQQKLIVTGQVIDAYSLEPLCYIAISLKNKPTGTVSNTEGNFTFHISSYSMNDTLIISSIGYSQYKALVGEITGKKLLVKLEPKIYAINEVKVKPVDPLEIIIQAIDKIPNNYPTESINMEGFYREMTFENDTCVELAEAACEFYYRPYTEPIDFELAIESLFKKTENHNDYFMMPYLVAPSNPKDRLKITEGRSSDLFYRNHIRVVPRGGPLSMVAHDLPKTKYFFCSKEKLKKLFSYKLEEVQSYQEKQVYVISLKPRKSSFKAYGRIYIDKESLAFIKFTLQLPKYNYKTAGSWTPALYSKKKKKCKDLINGHHVTLDYNYKKINNKWYLNYVSRKESFEYEFSKYFINKEEQPSFRYDIEQKLLINNYITENVNTYDSINNLANSFYSVLYEYDLDYNPEFWKTYNIIETTTLQDSIIKQLEMYQPLEKQFKEQFVKVGTIAAPVAKIDSCINPYTGLEDNYYWMQDIKNPEVLKYVEAENRYTENEMLPLKQFRRNLYYEMSTRQIKDTNKVPDYKYVGDYIYYFKKKPGIEYENLYRKNSNTGREEMVLNVQSILGIDEDVYIYDYYVHPNNRLIAYIISSVSLAYQNTLVVYDIKRSQKIEEIENITNIVWKINKDAFYYATWDDQNRIDRLIYHVVNTTPDNDKLIYKGKNKQKNITIDVIDNKWLNVCVMDENYYNDIFTGNLEDNEEGIKKIVNNKDKCYHSIFIQNDTLYSLSREGDLSTFYYTEMENPEQENWKVLIEGKANEGCIGHYVLLKDYIVIQISKNMYSSFKVYTRKGEFVKDIKFKEPVISLQLFANNTLNTNNSFRYSVSSLISPAITYDYNIVTDKQSLVKQEKIKGYVEHNYKTELIWATSTDGTKIPITIAWNKKRSKTDGKSPLYLYAYGSAGVSISPHFSTEILSLLNRGVIYAIAHVRGGNELGDNWHEDAMRLHKKNTFNDYIACAKYLIENNYTSKGKIIAEGGSAGGLVMGTVANEKPELFNSVILVSPVVNPLQTLTDSTAKFSDDSKAEWGDVSNPEVFDYIKSYSPYQNIKAQSYPIMLYYIGLNDDRVEYWQSLKSVAKLRSLKTGTEKLYLKIELYAGHTGYFGEDARYAKMAFIYAFVLDNLGIKH